MLLVDVRGQVQSLAPCHAPVPFVREWFRHDLTRADALFRRRQRDVRFMVALHNELQQCLSWQLGAHSYPDALLEAARRAIADGLIPVANELGNDWVLRFDELRPTEWDPHRLVVFPTSEMTERCVVAALETPDGPAAITAAVFHLPRRRQGGIQASASNGSLVA